MSKLTITFALVLFLTVWTSDTLAKSWRQITPLRSTAQDVAVLSQACAEVESRCQFELEDQEVMIVFSGSKIGALECERVPKRTVLAVIVRFNHPGRPREFQLK